MARKSKRRRREQGAGSREQGAGSRERANRADSLYRAQSVLLAALAALVVARTLVPEDPGGQHGYGAPLDVLWLVLAGAWLLVRWRGAAVPLRFGWPDALMVALVGWHTLAALAAFTAASPRPAMNMLWDWAAMGTLFLLARQLVITPTSARAVVVVMIGLACGLSAVAARQSLVTIPADIRAYDAAQDSPLALYELTGQWLPPGSSTREQFESRLQSRLPTATFALSNSLAGFLVPWFVVLAAVGVGQRSRIVIGACGAIAALVLVCIWLAGSRTAGVAVAAGVLLLTATYRGTIWFQLPKRIIGIVAAGAILAAIAVVAILFTTPPGRRALDGAMRSMQYRFEYWQATAAMIVDYPWLGCGPGQFQDTYTAYKLPGAAEEVQDPHNWLFEVWATAGTPAAIALLALFAVIVVRVVRAGTLDAGRSMLDARSDPTSDRDFTLLGGVGGVVLGVAIAWLTGFPLARMHVVLLIAAMLGVWWSLRSWSRGGELPPGVPLVAALALLVNLLAAGGIGYPSVADSLWLLLAIALNTGMPAKPQAETPRTAVPSAATDGARRTPAKLGRWIAGLALAATLLTAIRFEYLPVLSFHLQWTRADRALAAGQAGPYRDALEAAVAADPWSAPAAARLAAQHFDDYETLSTSTQLERFLRADRRARELAPRRSGVWANSAEYSAAIYHATNDVEFLRQAGRYYERAIELYPTDARVLAQAAKFWQSVGDADRAQEAAIQALRSDDAHRAAGHRDRQLDDPLRRELESIAGHSPS